MLNKNEKRLRELIVKWTQHFKHRKDFLKWREDRMWQENHQEIEINFLEKIIPDLKSKKILDLGSGMGGFLVAMRNRGYNIIGLEFNAEYCEITKLRGKRYSQDVMAINLPGEKMPFEKESFDFIYCNDVLEHCENPFEFLKESRRVLKSDGQMYITVMNRFGFKDPHYHLKFLNWMPRFMSEKYIAYRKKSKDGFLGKDRQKLSEMHYFTYGQFQEMAKKIGFEVWDLRKYKILHPKLFSGEKFQKINKLLSICGLNRLIYFLFRSFYFGNFRLILKVR